MNHPSTSAHCPPAVSIGLPVYNGGNHLREALASLLNQRFVDFELIISDNASTDDTADIVREFQRRDSRIRYIRQPSNIGPAENYLAVLREARAGLFMWAAHDDIWADNWLEVLTASLTPDDVGVAGRLQFMKDGNVIADKRLPDFHRGEYIRYFLGNETNYRHHYVYSLFNREKLLRADMRSFHMDYYPDALFVYCLLSQGALRCLPTTHVRYRVHDQNLGQQFSKPWKGWKKILYRIHPLRYYRYYLQCTPQSQIRAVIAALIPVKHIYAQVSFWIRGFREIVTGKKVV